MLHVRVCNGGLGGKVLPKRNNVVMYVKLQDFSEERLAFKIVAFPGKFGEGGGGGIGKRFARLFYCGTF